MDITSRLEGLALTKQTSSSLAYVISLNGTTVCYLHPSSDQLTLADHVPTDPPLVPGQLYNLKRSAQVGRVTFTALSGIDHDTYVRRADFSFTPTGYKDWILPSILLAKRLRDYDQACATVIQRSPLVLSAPARRKYLKTLRFRAETGEIVDVIVDNVNREGDRNHRIFCTPTAALPKGVVRGCRLQFLGDKERLPPDTAVLQAVYDGALPIAARLVDIIYGKPGAYSYGPVSRELIKIRMKNSQDLLLNAEQSEFVWRYLDPKCPGIVGESPPGTGKTLTLAAMACSYRGGRQVFLSPANAAVFNIAVTLAGMDYGDRKIIHLLSALREATQQAQERSPFSVFVTEEGEEENSDLALFNELGDALKTANKHKKRRLLGKMRKAHAATFAANHCQYDIILATVDMILIYMMKKKDPKRPCHIQKLLAGVTRVVVDEASQLTEAALNALVHVFPAAQIVLIGDSRQLPPFKYVKGDLVSEMAACSALEVMKRRKNVPVISMRTTHRQCAPLMVYNEPFYEGRLVSAKPASTGAVLPSIFRSIKMDCAFVQVKQSKAEHSGTSLINDAEIGALNYLINELRVAGYGENSVMVITYYEAQRQLAIGNLPEGYEALTVDSAQGREKDVVIVLTTRDSANASTFFTCPRRCNVAVSRHKEALIILGHETLAEIEPWKQVLDKKYFSTVTYNPAN